jgi:PRTRC genetic system ThiF family protein
MTENREYIFDPPYRLNQIVVVGLGGTGSQVARCIARLLYHRQQKGQYIPQVLFVDPDVIESHNVGRQMFTPADVGNAKAMTLAKRFNLALGLDIVWSTDPLDSARHIQPGALVCGCVDNHQARAEIARAGEVVWLDAGNGYDSGQVSIGNSGDREQVFQGLHRAQEGHCRYLPHAGLLFPALLEPEPEENPAAALSCAERVMRDEQQVFVNDFIASILTQYVYRLLNREAVTTFVSFFSLSPAPTVRSVSITQPELAAYLGEE